MIDFNEIPKKSGIYKLTNTITNKIYIGKSNNLYSRIRDHAKSETSRDKFSYLQKSIKAHGWSVFEVEILECFDSIDNEELLRIEEQWIKKLNCLDKSVGYNILVKGFDRTGVKATEKTRRKMSAAKKGEKSYRFGMVTPQDVRDKISKTRKEKGIGVGAENPFYGKKHSPESLKKMSESLTGKYKGENNPLYGKLLSEEAKAKLRGKRDCITGPLHPMWGKNHTEESKQKIKDTKKKNFDLLTEEEKLAKKQRMSETAKKVDNTHRRKITQQINLQTGDLIKEYASLATASLESGVNINSICAVCNGKQKKAGGFFWRYKSTNEPNFATETPRSL